MITQTRPGNKQEPALYTTMKSENQLFRSSATAAKWQALLPLAAASLATHSDAAVIVTAVGTNVGTGGGYPGQVSSLTLDLPGINDIRFYFGGENAAVSYVLGLTFDVALGGTYLQSPRIWQAGATSAGAWLAQPVTAGKIIDNAPQTSRGISIVGGWDGTFATQYGTSFTDRYLMFQFKDSTSGGALRHGWVNLNFNVTAPSSANAFIKRYAYDTSGGKLQAGAISGAPEPGTAGASLLLGAMITGAAGVRRRRKAMAS